MLTLIIPVFRNEESIHKLLKSIDNLYLNMNGEMETVFVVDHSPDHCYEILRATLVEKKYPSKLALLSRNFGSFQAIRVGLQLGSGDRFAVMAADLQEPPELVLEMDRVLCEEAIDVVVGVRDARQDPLLSRIPAQLFWGLYRRFVVPEIPPGGVDVFGCNRQFRDMLLQLNERHSSLIAQIFWLGFRRKSISYVHQARNSGKSAWTFKKKDNLPNRQSLLLHRFTHQIVDAYWWCRSFVVRIVRCGRIALEGFRSYCRSRLHDYDTAHHFFWSTESFWHWNCGILCVACL